MRLTLFCQHSAHITHLEEEVAFWRRLYREERQRAELAIDRLLNQKMIGPVSLPLRPMETVQSEIDELIRTPEFMEAGGA